MSPPEFQEHRRYLWALCYRMTGVPADADDLVQETFARALERPPSRPDLPLKAWLTRVAVNLAKDSLRRRKLSAYEGPWLPGPVDTGEEVMPDSPVPSAQNRFELLESVSFAFLLALEVLTPQQRAVLVLREVFDYSVEEVAECLELSSTNVKVTHHRARKALARFDREESVFTRAVQEKTRSALMLFLSRLQEGDVAGIESMLASSVRCLTDGGDEFYAAKVPLVGSERVIQFFSRLMKLRGAPDHFEIRNLNGLPALIASYRPERCHAKEAPNFVLRVELDRAGNIRELHSVLASRKLSACFPALRSPSV